MKIRFIRIAAIAISMGIIAAGCSSDSSSPSGTDGSSDTTVATETSTETSNEWALAYTGATEGEAAGEPVRVGYVNQESLFPEATIGLMAAVDYTNKELSGFGGRPVEIVKCDVAVEEDGQKCGTQFANDPTVSVVLTGTLTVGNASLYAALDQKKPIVIGNGVTVADFVTKAGVAWTTGSIGVVQGMAKFTIKDLAAKTVAVIHSNNAAGKAAFDILLKPLFDAAKVTSIGVGVEDTATATDVQSALQAAGADKVDVLVPVVTVQGCSALYDAIKALLITPKVVTTGLCFGTPVKTHLADIGDMGDFPDGWYFLGYGASYFNPDVESGMQTYIDKVQQYGKPAEGTALEYTGFAGPLFANFLTVAKFYQQIGVEAVTAEGFNTAMRAFTGPMMIQAGDLGCGVAPFVAVCGHVTGVQQYTTAGGWATIASIDVRAAG